MFGGPSIVPVVGQGVAILTPVPSRISCRGPKYPRVAEGRQGFLEIDGACPGIRIAQIFAGHVQWRT